jgi:predicted O-linked N-acetylglucosamine transferase (SPINDLY family)
MSAYSERFAEAFAFHQSGDLTRAQALYEEILKVQPSHFDALHLLGVIAAQTRNPGRAVALVSRALEIDSRNAIAYFNRGSALQELGRLSAALSDYDQAIALNPGLVQAYANRGVILFELRRFQAALESCDKALQLDPSFAEAHFNRANALKGLELWDAALDGYDRAIAIRSNYAQAHFNRANLLRQLKRWEAAIDGYDKTIAIRGDFAGAHANRGNVLVQLKRWGEALASFDMAIAVRPEFADAHVGRGNALKGLKRLDESLSSYDRAIAIHPRLAEALSNRGLVLKELGRVEAALASCSSAIEIDPNLAGAYLNRGVVERELNRLESALENYDRAIDLKSDYAEAYSNRGLVLHELRRFEAALASFDHALAMEPDYADAHYNRGLTLRELKQFEASVESFDRAIETKSSSRYIDGIRLHTKMQICDWREIDSDLAQLTAALERGEPVSPPFPLLALSGSASLQRLGAQIWVREELSSSHILPAVPRARREKIRIGYFSADYHSHATSHLIAELLETHDRDRFDITLFSFGPETNDAMRMRLRAAGHEFFDVRDKSDEQIAQLARDRFIDIAVDLKGFTKDSRTGIFARRAAPLQVNYLGYPGTMAADFIDYLIADRTLIPEASRRHYAEKIVYLPDSYQPNDARRSTSDKEFTREELGLPRDGFVFCCFNNNYKITPGTFESWMNILKRVDGSVLWLFEDNPSAAGNLRREAVARGVGGERLLFGRRISTQDHLARHRAADLFLDTLPYNAHTTASDALWAGLPVLSRVGEAFAARVAASLLTAIGLPELIVASAEEYEELAVELAMAPQRLAGIKLKLAENRVTAPLFDTVRYARSLEAAYVLMYERFHAGLPAEHLFVEPAAI